MAGAVLRQPAIDRAAKHAEQVDVGKIVVVEPSGYLGVQLDLIGHVDNAHGTEVAANIAARFPHSQSHRGRARKARGEDLPRDKPESRVDLLNQSQPFAGLGG
ncbi:hypothetical protein SDC9_93953 [bioreactor metagenome]|uniref:Uncharacterized protein n=1 Tax=bioreactor metagenome TaxID=1076179 RepID=A0A645A232_9ZZZZ